MLPWQQSFKKILVTMSVPREIFRGHLLIEAYEGNEMDIRIITILDLPLKLKPQI